MKLTVQDKERAYKHVLSKLNLNEISEWKCSLCNVGFYKIAPVLLDIIVQGSPLVANEYVQVSMVAFQCVNCNNIVFFNRNIIEVKEDGNTQESS